MKRDSDDLLPQEYNVNYRRFVCIFNWELGNDTVMQPVRLFPYLLKDGVVLSVKHLKGALNLLNEVNGVMFSSGCLSD